MGYSIGYADGRDIGYGVIATCDQPDCEEKIDRGISYCCGGFFGDHADSGCGLYFCSKHLQMTYVGEGEENDDSDEFADLCERCAKGDSPFDPKPDHPDWVWWKLNHSSWATWRADNADEVVKMHNRLVELAYVPADDLKEWVKGD
jgi:hypothetical protein